MQYVYSTEIVSFPSTDDIVLVQYFPMINDKCTGLGREGHTD